MIKSLRVENFTAFSEAKLDFGKHLNVIVGENGTGKTHLLKLAYAVLATSWQEGRKPLTSGVLTRSVVHARLAEKLVNVFRPESLGRLVRRRRSRERCQLQMTLVDQTLDIAFGFSAHAKSELREVRREDRPWERGHPARSAGETPALPGQRARWASLTVEKLPTAWVARTPIYLPTRELFTIYPLFVALHDGQPVDMEETWRDTCLLLGAPAQKDDSKMRGGALLWPLVHEMGGTLHLDRNGRFYLHHRRVKTEMPLVAESVRKLGMLARLLATGALLDRGCLFWDTPEADLNPRIIKVVARLIVALARDNIQVFLAMHSLFLLREIDLLIREGGSKIDVRFFGFHRSEDGVLVKQGPSPEDIGAIAALDEELEQSDRYMIAQY